MKNLAELQYECAVRGIVIKTSGRASKEPYIAALGDHFWRREHPGEPIPTQTMPMLLRSWDDLAPDEAASIEGDQHAWCIQAKLDGVRANLHCSPSDVRITGRTISEVTYRLSEFQSNLPHLTAGLDQLAGTVLDGELVCPVAEIDTGDTITAHPLQAAVAILATSPEKARLIQARHKAHLRFHAFDILAHLGRDVTGLSLSERLELLRQAVEDSNHSHLAIVPTFIVGKPAIHRRIIEAGGEGTVWKRLDRPYEPGKRVPHWIKRKASLTVEGVVIGSKPGSKGKGHENLIGAVAFGLLQRNGTVKPIAWVSAWSDSERRALTQPYSTGFPQLNPSYIGRRALVAGQNESAKSGRLRHARHLKWLS